MFRLSRTDPDEGTAVAALGYPLNQQLSITEGIVSAVGVSARVNGERVEDQLLASVAINPGNSGGPLVLSDGTLVGVVSSVGLDDDGTRAEGRSHSISATVARRAIAGLSDSARTIRTADCSRDDEQQAPAPYEGDEGLGEDERILLEVGISSDDPRASVFGDLVGQLGQGINDGDYEAAFDLFTDSMQRRAGGVRSWSAGLNSSYWRQLDIDDVSSSSEAPVVTVYLQTEQASAEGYQGQSCSVWHNRYYLQKSAGSANGWLIKRVQGAKPRPCA